MKKLITIALVAATFVAFAQGNPDTAKADTLLHLPAIGKTAAKRVLEAMSIGNMVVSFSNQISARTSTECTEIYKEFMQLIFQKWPDLIPKPQTTK